MEIGSAVEFVQQNGNEIEKARLRYCMNREHPSRTVVDSLLSGQRAEGGWAPFWAPEYSGLDATCFRLAQAEALGVDFSEPPIRRAVDFLIGRQALSGSWEEDPTVAGQAPPWVQPGNPAARLYLTANCGFWLAVLGHSRRNPDRKEAALESAMRAGKFLLTASGAQNRFPGFLQTNWLAAALWYHIGFNAAADSLLDHLAERLDEMDAGSLAWMITSLDVAGVPPEQEPLPEAARRLARLQDPDGRWRSQDGTAFDVHTTLEALRSLKVCPPSF